MENDADIEYEDRIVPCEDCRGTGKRRVRIWKKYPKLVTPPRSAEEHKSAQTPTDWGETAEGSDNIEARDDDRDQ